MCFIRPRLIYTICLSLSFFLSRGQENPFQANQKRNYWGIQGSIGATSINQSISPFKTGVGFKAGLTNIYSVNSFIDAGVNLTYSAYADNKTASGIDPLNNQTIIFGRLEHRLKMLELKPFIQVSLLERFLFKPFVSVGLSTGYILDVSRHIYTNTQGGDFVENAKNRFKKFNWGGEIGLGSKILLSDRDYFTIKVSYERSFSKLNLTNPDYPDAWKNQALQLSLFIPIKFLINSL
ncbi:hypothetical protein BWI97_14165 [Siphonobacter sp. BAB-5405]|nr:hypothetical protein BWI97_14165 [Siphonobacter sp. BAB-5405]